MSVPTNPTETLAPQIRGEGSKFICFCMRFKILNYFILIKRINKCLMIKK
nr:MAG TPA: hypothetical protein [Caudoviricetes sp.]